MRVNKMEAMYGRLHANVKVEPGTTLYATIASILFTRIKRCPPSRGS